MTDKYKILMIDDEQDIIHFLTKTFENFKHVQFFTSMRAGQGIEIAKQERPKVILLDLRMPGMNGEEALVELKKLLPETKFIIMTGWEDGGETRERIEGIGVDAYYTKPIDLEKVVSKIMSMVMIKES